MIIGDSASIYVVLGWNVVINLFYIPGTMLGALALDYVKPKRMIIAMLIVQAVIGFIMSGLYDKLSQPQNIAAFAVVYGLFLSFGEAGPCVLRATPSMLTLRRGNCIGLLASKSSPTGFRGQYYGLAAAIGKIGAFAGTWAFPALIADFPADSNRGITGPFYLGSGLAILAAIIAFIFVRELDADSMQCVCSRRRSSLTPCQPPRRGVRGLPRRQRVRHLGHGPARRGGLADRQARRARARRQGRGG